jgi:hypothetical protein
VSIDQQDLLRENAEARVRSIVKVALSSFKVLRTELAKGSLVPCTPVVSQRVPSNGLFRDILTLGGGANLIIEQPVAKAGDYFHDAYGGHMVSLAGLCLYSLSGMEKRQRQSAKKMDW